MPIGHPKGVLIEISSGVSTKESSQVERRGHDIQSQVALQLIYQVLAHLSVFRVITIALNKPEVKLGIRMPGLPDQPFPSSGSKGIGSFLIATATESFHPSIPGAKRGASLRVAPFPYTF